MLYTVQYANAFPSILSFLLVAGPADQAVAWAQLSADQRSSIKAAYNAAGISLMVAAFGATDEPTSRGTDPVGIANRLADWVIQYGLDGVDIDYEDFTAINRQDGSAENWLISLTRQLRFRLPAGQYIITHAPVAPWFSKAKYPTGAYATVHAQVGNLIDWVRRLSWPSGNIMS
jgi:chitinase